MSSRRTANSETAIAFFISIKNKQIINDEIKNERHPSSVLFSFIFILPNFFPTIEAIVSDIERIKIDNMQVFFSKIEVINIIDNAKFR